LPFVHQPKAETRQAATQQRSQRRSYLDGPTAAAAERAVEKIQQQKQLAATSVNCFCFCLTAKIVGLNLDLERDSKEEESEFIFETVDNCFQ